MDINPYKEFAKTVLGVEFHDISLLITAFTHRSYVNEHKKSVHEHNERLEFLGDAVLELVATNFLFRNYAQPEGILTSWRSALVRTESIGAAATKLGYEKLLRMSKGEKHDTGRAREQILANSFEAVLGALYLDQGYDIAAKFVNENLLNTFQEILDSGSWMDPKSHLQEVVQAEGSSTPVYQLLGEEGPDHDKVFTIGVVIDNKLVAKGVGPSKQSAQVEAAKKALMRYKK
jgi:ribonuclease-3